MERLIEGFRRFRETYYEQNRSLFDALARHGQSPKALIISCCDSRVDPGMIFDAGPGDAFVVRNVANLVPPYAPSDELHGTSAAIEFAVRGLEVEHIVLLGHENCGGIKALLEGPQAGEFIGPWMRIAGQARERTLQIAKDQPPEVARRVCEHEALKVSLANLMTFPWIRSRVQEGRLALHVWYYELETGDLLWLSDSSGDFRPVGSSDEAQRGVEDSKNVA